LRIPPSEGVHAVFGLGNPGREYARTRHNAGAMVVDELAARWRIRLWRRRFLAACGTGAVAGKRVWLVKPRTYMNLSGRSVAAAVSRLGLEADRFLVVTDDIALPLGNIRLRRKGSAGGHKGLQSVIDELASETFDRLRMGVGDPGDVDAAAYVLTPFDAVERTTVEETIKRAADAAAYWLERGAQQAMATFND
jgi:PTH1 family peptidyl-tRNA hydrolase